MNINIFVSYSPADNELVSAIVSLLSANNGALVCCDADSLRTSGRWRDELETAISEADVVLVFWCHHSHTSYEVRKEFALALEQARTSCPCYWMQLRCLASLPAVAISTFVPASEWCTRRAPEQGEPGGLAVQAEADRLIASDISRHYEELLVMSLAREIETELASRLGPK